VAWRGVAWRGVAWRGVAWRGVAWRGVAWRGAFVCVCASQWRRRRGAALAGWPAHKVTAAAAAADRHPAPLPADQPPATPTAAWSVTSMWGMLCTLGSPAMPGLPGATNSCLQSADWESFQARACSRPPLPTTSTLVCVGRCARARRRGRVGVGVRGVAGGAALQRLDGGSSSLVLHMPDPLSVFRTAAHRLQAAAACCSGDEQPGPPICQLALLPLVLLLLLVLAAGAGEAPHARAHCVVCGPPIGTEPADCVLVPQQHFSRQVRRRCRETGCVGVCGVVSG
jgi:hypothetical protein